MASKQKKNETCQRAEFLRLGEDSYELGELGVEQADTLTVARANREEAEQRRELELDEMERRSDGLREICAQYQDAIRHGQQVVRLRCQHLILEECMLSKLHDGTISICPLDRIAILRSDVNQLQVPAWGSSDKRRQSIGADELLDVYVKK